jgi:hypothetical protein
MIAIISTATLRNWLASSTFVPIASSFGVNLYLGNRTPAAITTTPGSGYLSMVLQIARAAPGLFADNLWHKALYTLGFFSAYAPTEGTAPGLIATWSTALIGVAVMIWGRVADGLRGPIRALPLAIAVSHFLVATLIFPVERLIIPLYILLLPYAALGVIWSIDFLVPPEEE